MNMEDESAPVSKFMTKTVITANVDQTIQSVCKMMHENRIGSLVIVKGGMYGNEPLGIITESDIIHNLGSVELFTTQTPVRELMSNNIISIKPHNTISDAIRIMHGNNIRRLPVVDDNNGKMIGIITDKDILKAVARKTSITTAYIPKEFDIEE
jgi:CBS domain-containing protein